jgi:phage-related holin
MKKPTYAEHVVVLHLTVISNIIDSKIHRNNEARKGTIFFTSSTQVCP